MFLAMPPPPPPIVLKDSRALSLHDSLLHHKMLVFRIHLDRSIHPEVHQQKIRYQRLPSHMMGASKEACCRMYSIAMLLVIYRPKF